MTSPTGGLDASVTIGSARSPRTSGTSGASGSGAARPGGDLGKDAFMSLLVASMKYQNPSSPMDGQEYMAQLAQFAQVEKLQAIEASTAELSSWQKAVAGQAMLGRTVSGAGAAGSTVTGTVTGVTLGSAGPRLTLTDGTSMEIDKVTAVHGPDGPTAAGGAAG